MAAPPIDPDFPPPTAFSERDEKYIRERFVRLAEFGRICDMSVRDLRGWQRNRLFPNPTYVSSDGTEWYPRSCATIVRRARSQGVSLRSLFFHDFRTKLGRLRREEPNLFDEIRVARQGQESTDQETIAAYWQVFLSGQYGACLKVPWVPCMIQKERLVRRIDTLVAQPHSDDEAWRLRLRRAVDSLDRLEQPFAEWDRVRFGRPLTRDTRVDAVRTAFPEAFQRQDRAGATMRIPTRQESNLKVDAA